MGMQLDDNEFDEIEGNNLGGYWYIHSDNKKEIGSFGIEIYTIILFLT